MNRGHDDGLNETTVTFNPTSRHSALSDIEPDHVEGISTASSLEKPQTHDKRAQLVTPWIRNHYSTNESNSQMFQTTTATAHRPDYGSVESSLHLPAVALSNSWSSNFSLQTQSENADVELSMVGLGIDSRPTIEDATEASVRALQDVLNRSLLCTPNRPTDRNPWQVQIKLGVPAQSLSPSKPMAVNLARLTAALPAGLIILSINVVVGGLWASGTETCGNSDLCTVVACLTLQKPASTPVLSVAAVHPLPQSSWTPKPREPKAREQPLSQPKLAVSLQPTSREDNANSMDMLARISEEVRENQVPACSPTTFRHGFHRSFDHDKAGFSDREVTPTEKLPEAVTAKNHRRQYVQHNYTDHGCEKPTVSDGAMVLSGKGYNTAFPIKLHEVLSEVAKDCRDDIMSWQPHGRSFKIHKHQEFIDLVLPQYFVMTKKSSFLRQLNLYGFNRISVGADKGAYYHELFLRSMRFLCRRMTRNKINGNGIRSAGNPQQEPNFYIMPNVPLEQSAVEAVPLEFSSEDTEDGDSHSHQTGSPVMLAEARTPEMGRSQAMANHMSFPLKLQSMLDTLELQANNDIISWLPHGRGFIVHQPDDFVNELMSKYFRQTK